MIELVKIRDNTKSPVKYISDLENFSNGKVYTFKPGINIIVGENGCGKTTLLKLIERYLIIDFIECSKGEFNNRIDKLFGFGDEFLGGVDIYADYDKNTFRLSHQGETGKDVCANKEFFAEYVNQIHSSTGEGVIVALNSLFNYMFSKDAKLKFDYEEQFKEYWPDYVEYVKNHRKNDLPNEFTIIMDEPDRNLSLENIENIKPILSTPKEQTQLIVTIHNPLLIYSLADNSHINFIEMTEGYIEKVKKSIDKLIKK